MQKSHSFSFAAAAVIFLLSCCILLNLLFESCGEARCLLRLKPGTVVSAQALEDVRGSGLFAKVQTYSKKEIQASVAGRASSAVCLSIGLEDVLRSDLISGRGFFATDMHQNYVLIDQSLAQSLFGRIDVAGQALRLDGKTYDILGVLRPAATLSQRLASYGVKRVFALQDDAKEAGYVMCTPAQGISSALALNWLQKNTAFSSQIESTFDLSSMARSVGLLARFFLALYGACALSMLWKLLAPIRKRIQAANSPLANFWAIVGRKALLAMLRLLFLALVGSLVLFLGQGVDIAPAFIPARLTLTELRRSFFTYVTMTNTQVSLNGPLFANLIWMRRIILCSGGCGMICLWRLRRKEGWQK